MPAKLQSPIAIGLSLMLLSGCAAPQLSFWNLDPFPRATTFDPVSRIVCIWEPAEGTGLDGLPTRGMAGQLLFFTRGEPSPVQVEGDVRIYLFDDSGTSEERAKPIHQFDFLGDAWTVHLSNSTLGAAYNVFIPYVRKHGRRVNCSLRVRLTPSEGPVVFSPSTQITLPGIQEEAPTDETLAPKNAETQQAPKAEPLQATLRRQTITPATSPANPQLGVPAATPPTIQREPIAPSAGTTANSPDRWHVDRSTATEVSNTEFLSRRRFRLASTAGETDNLEGGPRR